MELTPFVMYLYGVTDDIKATCFFAVVICVAISGVVAFNLEDGKAGSYIGFIKIALLSAALIAVIGLLLPSSKTIATMCLVPKIANGESVSGDEFNVLKGKTGDKTTKYLIEKLEEINNRGNNSGK